MAWKPALREYAALLGRAVLVCRFSGVVQGVGFRPSVYRIATTLGIQGGVYNDSSCAIVLLACSPSLQPPESTIPRFVRFYPLRYLPAQASMPSMLGSGSQGSGVYVSSPLWAFFSKLFSAECGMSAPCEENPAKIGKGLRAASHKADSGDFAMDSALPLAPFAKITQVECFSLESARTQIPSLESSLRQLRAYYAKHAPRDSAKHIDQPTNQPASHYAKQEKRTCFYILDSATTQSTRASSHAHEPMSLPTDSATCPACVRDLFDERSRFYRYHLTACTLCGARYSIMRALPYDRERTSMRDFALCDECERDFRTPSSRFFHAQPLSCSKCAIPLHLLDSSGNVIAQAYTAIERAATLLEQGEILCIKGLGGFALICDSSNAKAVRALRERKKRASKPFAIMCRDLPQARSIALLNQAESNALSAPQAPIILAWSNPANPLHLALAHIAPNLATIGILLANTPLHHLLLAHFPKPIIYTSANLPNEPIITECAQVLESLRAIASYVLEIKREVVHGIDDSIMRYIDGAIRPIRLARGSTPESIPLAPLDFTQKSALDSGGILALGANDKITPTLVQPHSQNTPPQARADSSKQTPSPKRAHHLIITPYIGSLDSPSAQARLESNLALFGIHLHGNKRVDFALESARSIAFVISDKHPRYQSTLIAQNLAHTPCQSTQEICGKPTDNRAMRPQTTHLQIFHHHAHHCAILHEIQERVSAKAAREILSIVWDGSGLGENGSIWGGEFLYGDFKEVARVGCFMPFALLGGERAITDIARIAYVLALHAKHKAMIARYERQIPAMLQTLAHKSLQNPMKDSCKIANLDSAQSHLTSSVGRLIDGVAHILGLLESTRYEGEAGALLESCALRFCDIRGDFGGSASSMSGSPIIELEPYPYRILYHSNIWVIDWREMIYQICQNLLAKTPLKTERPSTNHPPIAQNPPPTPAAQIAPKIAYRFFYTLAHIACDYIKRFSATRESTHDKLHVGFSGGVFQNKLLCEILGHLLRKRGVVYGFHTRVPCNDGGIAYGQAIYGYHALHQPKA